MEQFSLVGGVHSGAGALGLRGSSNQTGNLLGLDPSKTGHGVRHEIGNEGVGKHRKKRFGSTGTGHMFDYPEIAVKGTGNGQAYRMSKAGYLPGNGGGEGGFGWRHADAHFTPAANVTDAQEVAEMMIRKAEHLDHHVKESHYRYVDRTKEDMQEKLSMMAEDHQRDRIKHLMSQGFTEEEVSHKLAKERERNIEKAERQPHVVSHLLEAKMAKEMPIQLNEDFAGTSVAPGAIPLRKDLSAFERATGQGNPVARMKQFEQLRHRERLREKMPDRVEPMIAKQPMKYAEVVQMLLKDVGGHQKKMDGHLQKHETQVVDHQHQKKMAEARQHDAMQRAMGESKINHYKA